MVSIYLRYDLGDFRSWPMI